MSATEPSIVIGIPGKWRDRSDIVTSIAGRSGGYLFAGRILMHSESGRHFELEIYDHEPSLAEKVSSGGRGQIPEDDLDSLNEHTHTLYLLSDTTGREVVEGLMDAVVGLLDSGGLVVKIESAGYSVSAEQWRDHASVKAAYSLYSSMVTLVGEERKYFTCGMKAFGLPDCSVHDSDLQTAFEVSTEFCCYMMDEAPNFLDGHTFSVPDGTERFRLSFEDYPYYPPGDMFYNPNGIWRLNPLPK